MIIDISYIKTVLQTDAEESQIKYLINHCFEDICEKINVETTLTQQDITDLPLTINEELVDITNRDTTLFQDTLIWGIACNLQNMDISVTSIPSLLYDEVIDKIDITNIPLNEDNLYDITFCDIYHGCINELNDLLNDESNVGYLRRLLNLSKDDIGDNEIEFLIDHYTEYLKETIKDVDPESAYFKQAVYLSVACHIYRTQPVSIASPTEYKVDEVSEKFGLNFDKYGNTWCDLADEAISDLKKNTYKNFGVKTFDRPGARTKYNAWGPTSGR